MGLIIYLLVNWRSILRNWEHIYYVLSCQIVISFSLLFFSAGDTATETSSDTQYIKLLSRDHCGDHYSLDPTTTTGNHFNMHCATSNCQTGVDSSVDTCNHTNQLMTTNACVCHEGGLHKVLEHMPSDFSEGQGQTTVDSCPLNLESQEDDTSNLNSGNFSENSKVGYYA